jgi:hypothetical protein
MVHTQSLLTRDHVCGAVILDSFGGFFFYVCLVDFVLREGGRESGGWFQTIICRIFEQKTLSVAASRKCFKGTVQQDINTK